MSEGWKRACGPGRVARARARALCVQAAAPGAIRGRALPRVGQLVRHERQLPVEDAPAPRPGRSESRCTRPQSTRDQIRLWSPPSIRQAVTGPAASMRCGPPSQLMVLTEHLRRLHVTQEPNDCKARCARAGSIGQQGGALHLGHGVLQLLDRLVALAQQLQRHLMPRARLLHAPRWSGAQQPAPLLGSERGRARRAAAAGTSRRLRELAAPAPLTSPAPSAARRPAAQSPAAERAHRPRQAAAHAPSAPTPPA